MSNILALKNNFKNYFTDAFSIDLRALAVFRIGLGISLIYFLFNLCQDITMFFTDDGLVSRAELIKQYSSWPLNWRHSVYLLSSNKFYFIILFSIQFISAGLFTIGYKTRLNCILSWFLLLSLQNRNFNIMSGFDLYLRLLLFWSIFLPLNTKYSFDNLFFKQKFNNKYFSIATVAILLQIAMFYFFSSILKTIDDKWWTHNTALNYILHNDLYLTPVGYMIHGFFSNYFLHVVTGVVLLIEFLTPFALFCPIKQPYRDNLKIFWFIVLLGLHLAFRTFLYIGPFFLICAVAILIILPGKAWDGFENLKNKIYIFISGFYRSRINKEHQNTSKKYNLDKILQAVIKNLPKQTIKLDVSKPTKIFIFVNILVISFINFATFCTQYKYKLPIIHEYAEVVGLDQRWGFFDRPATVSHMLRFYGLEDSGGERSIWPIDGYNVVNKDIREYFYGMKNNWWWKYFISYNVPDDSYNYFLENCLIRSLCTKENNKKNLPHINRIKILYNYYPQVYDPGSKELTKYGPEGLGRYYIQKCP